MDIEVGKIKNNKCGFMKLSVAVNINKGGLDSDMQIDTRIISNEKKLKKITKEYLDKLNKLVLEELLEDKGE